MGPLVGLYADAMQKIIDIIGYEAAYKALFAEVHNRLDATLRHALDRDGAFANEAAQIIRDYPDWNPRFENSAGGFRLVVSAPKTDQAVAEKPLIERRIREAFEKYKQVTHPGIRIETVE